MLRKQRYVTYVRSLNAINTPFDIEKIQKPLLVSFYIDIS